MEKLRYAITEQNMPENRFSLTPIFPYKDRIVDSVLIREYTSQRKPVFWHVLHSAYWKKYWKSYVKILEKC